MFIGVVPTESFDTSYWVEGHHDHLHAVAISCAKIVWLVARMFEVVIITLKETIELDEPFDLFSFVPYAYSFFKCESHNFTTTWSFLFNKECNILDLS